MDFSEMVDHQVTLSGVAYNALGSAVVADPDGEWFVYVDGLESWDDGDYGKKVEVTGLLVREAIAPRGGGQRRSAHPRCQRQGPGDPQRDLGSPGLGPNRRSSAGMDVWSPVDRSGSARRSTSRVTGATSPTPKNRNRRKLTAGWPSVHSR